MNKFFASGNLTRDPRTNTVNTANGAIKVTNFTLAVNKRNGETQFWNCAAWRNAADVAEKYLRKGMPIIVEGEVGEPTIYDRNDGTKGINLVANIDTISFINSGNSNNNSANASTAAAANTAQAATATTTVAQTRTRRANTVQTNTAPAAAAPAEVENDFDFFEGGELPF